MLHIDEWTDFEAHDITELALSVSDEIYGSVEEGIRELNLLDEWLDEQIEEGTCDEVRQQLLQGFYHSLGFHGDWQDYFSANNCDRSWKIRRHLMALAMASSSGFARWSGSRRCPALNATSCSSSCWGRAISAVC